MRYKYLFALGIGAFTLAGTLHAQTVFTVGKESVSKSEFLNWYQKNNSKGLKYDKASLENFVKLYSRYKMKVMEAEALKMDTIPQLKSDIEMYRNQLAKNYITDKSLIEKMAKEAYDRLMKERQVAHIMMSGYGALAEQTNLRMLDSLAAAINEGKISFEKAAAQYSTDRATSGKGGNIGYITSFQTPYDFENVVYSTPVGAISKAFKSPTGYHIVKILAERGSSDTVEVAQILLATSGLRTDEVQQKQQLMQRIQAEARGGANFESLVAKYSEDEYSKDKNGLIPAIYTGSADPIVEQAVFALKNVGDVSDIVVTEYGIHLFQLKKRKPVGSYEQERERLVSRIERSRADALKQANFASVKQTLGFKEYPAALQAFIQQIDQSDFGKDARLKDYPELKDLMFEIGSTKYNQQDFLGFIKQLTQGRVSGRKEDVLTELYRVFTEKSLTDAQLKHLEKNNAEFKKLASEYRNGVLIFDLMDKNIWSKASQDTAGLRAFYERNASKYVWQPGFKGVVFQSKNHEALVQILQALKDGASVSEALKAINTPASSEKIYQQTGRFEFSQVAHVDKNTIVPNIPLGIFPDVKEGEIVIFAEEVNHEPQRKTLEEARDALIDDYQKYLEEEWHKSLERKYPLKINTAVLNSLVK